MNPRRYITFLISLTAILLTVAASARKHETSTNMRPSIADTQVVIDVYEYDFVDVQPQFPGGESAMIRFINNERRYPVEAYHSGIEGRVLCSFIVNTDGSISHVAVLRGVEESLNREAVRIISNMPAWQVGILNDRPVPVYCILPIAFRK